MAEIAPNEGRHRCSFTEPPRGAWATFAQIDNAPLHAPVTSGTFNFFNPHCKGPADITTPCPYNVKDADPG